MSEKTVYLTYEGLKERERELEYLKTEKRKEISEKIKVALGFGDLSENAEYDEAKNEQAEVELKIIRLEKMLKNAKVIDEEEISTDVVSIGIKVKVLDIEMDEEEIYSIVGSEEADPMQNRISDESPVGKAILGAKVGDTVTVSSPNGEFELKILEISK
ncbi:MAG: transcription elongation factor GreA [Ruminococcaceae bacterium]|nr:transcription elongation factor GreA [Oscillospiraceae bacterium]